MSETKRYGALGNPKGYGKGGYGKSPDRPAAPQPAYNGAPLVRWPVVIGPNGQPVAPRSDDYIEGHEVGTSQPYAVAQAGPLGWNSGKPDGSRMVGWTLRKQGASKIQASHAFSINPQSIARTDSSRNQLFATQDLFYVDDFGPGPIQIQINQLVAHGRPTAAAGGALQYATMREDVIRFYELIYIPMVANPGVYDVYFHDNHLWPELNGKVPEQVYFPPQAWNLTRSVQLHNVWQLALTMSTLVAPPRESKVVPRLGSQPKIKTYVVRQGETLKKLAAKLAGKNATHQTVLQLEMQIVALTKKYGKDDITKARQIPTYTDGGSVFNGYVHVGRLHLAPGEKIILPTG